MKFHLGVFVSLLLQAIIVNIEASNILGVFLSPSPSHLIIHTSVARALAEQGHNVTVITSLPLKDKNPAYRHIHLKTLSISTEKFINEINETPIYLKVFKMFSLFYQFIDIFSKYPSDPEFVSFTKENNQFDLVLLGYVFNDYLLGVAAEYKCPVALIWIVQPFGQINRLIGNPTHSEFVPFSPFMDAKPMDFQSRVINFLAAIAERSLLKLLGIFTERAYNENYPSDNYPTLQQMQDNISLVLFNHHFSEGPVRPLVPGMVEIGGIQIKDKPDPLPEDVLRFLENSPKGAIFFSLGSNVKDHHIGSKIIDMIHKTLSGLPYNVICKIDTENPPRNATNILFKKWLPQDDILAHKNLKLFVTHAGKGSVTESEYHQVPMVALPVFGDQPKNAETMQAKGHGIALDYTTMTEESLKTAILEVMENDKYRNTVRRFSKLYRDRPLTARENAVYWIEYVIRHRGAPHMQSPLKRLNILQENSIDVILFLSISVYVIFKILKIFVRIAILIVKKVLKIGKSKID